MGKWSRGLTSLATRVAGSRLGSAWVAVFCCGSVLVDSLLVLPGPMHHAALSPVNTNWRYPCGNTLMMTRSKSLARWRYWNVEHDNDIVEGKKHPSNRPLRRIRTQIRHTQDHFIKLQREIADIYSGVMKTVTNVHYNWLPEKQLHWFQVELRCLDKHTKVERMLPALHSGLRNYSATFESLIGIRDFSSIYSRSDYNRRYYLLERIAQELRSLLCEVETGMMYMGLAVRPPGRLLEIHRHFKELTMDHTRVIIQDWGVILSYQNYLDDWTRMIRRVVGKKGNMACKTKSKKSKFHKRPLR
ncbi:uncharacterized protein LOC111047910 [Nilaparvata lugens]|uniref:uncharacterized protein LOC111047910 n=1 Tax=Nilaparvata lugens TaxID=108931 RepID=UPI00193E1291|nr:uncharacterized protein LOC111047910 [Nilaparvata lugens]